MSAPPFTRAQILFFALLVLAVPVGTYHLVSGRFPQAIMAYTAACVGLFVARQWRREQVRTAREFDEQGQTVFVPPPVPRPKAPVLRARPVSRRAPVVAPAPREDRLGPGVGAGILATAAMLAVVAAIEALAHLVGRAGSAGVAGWVFQFGHTAVDGGLTDIPLRAAVLLVTLGIGCSVVYVELAESSLPGQPWQRGLLFGGIVWILAMFFAVPMAGAGPLGAALQAGPLPALTLLLATALYGVLLATRFARRRVPARRGPAAAPGPAPEPHPIPAPPVEDRDTDGGGTG